VSVRTGHGGRHIKRLAFVLVVAALVGCVYVARHGSYQRTEVIEQSGSNRVSQVDLDLKP
jgi:hypothetical protein